MNRAHRAATATLSTLGERVTRGQADTLAAACPPSCKHRCCPPGIEAEPFGAEESVRRVAVRE